MKLGTIDKRLLTILLVVFVQMLGASLIFPVLPLYAQRQFNMSAEMITLARLRLLRRPIPLRPICRPPIR